MKTILLATATFAGFAGSSYAQAADNTNTKELIVTKQETVRIEPQTHIFDLLEIREDAVLEIVGSTNIVAKKLVALEGATIRYIPSEVDNPFLNINSMDSREVQSLTVIGNGLDGNGFAESSRAPDGGQGGRAYSRLDGFEIRNNRCGVGGNGSNGQSGANGTDALDISLTTPLLNPGAKIVLEAIGGNGGRGQNAGHGGKGGGGSSAHTPCHGGTGGTGGKGGDGGDAGRVSVIFVTKDTPQGQYENVIDEQLKSVTLDVMAARGARGSGGSAGFPGAGGDDNRTIVVDGSNRVRMGQPGQRGHDGSEGDGPQPNAPQEQWLTVDVIDAASYAQLLLPYIMPSQQPNGG